MNIVVDGIFQIMSFKKWNKVFYINEKIKFGLLIVLRVLNQKYIEFIGHEWGLRKYQLPRIIKMEWKKEKKRQMREPQRSGLQSGLIGQGESWS